MNLQLLLGVKVMPLKVIPLKVMPLKSIPLKVIPLKVILLKVMLLKVIPLKIMQLTLFCPKANPRCFVYCFFPEIGRLVKLCSFGKKKIYEQL